MVWLLEGTHEYVGMLRQQVMQRGCAGLWFSNNEKVRRSQFVIHHVASMVQPEVGSGKFTQKNGRLEQAQLEQPHSATLLPQAINRLWQIRHRNDRALELHTGCGRRKYAKWLWGRLF